jgi:membrane protease YdiL (CAAX protease family)
MMSLLQLIVGAMVMALVALSLIAWMVAVERWRRGLPLLEYEARRPVPWGVVDFIFAILACAAAQASAVVFIMWWNGIDATSGLASVPLSIRTGMMIAESLATLAGLALAVGGVRLRTGATWHDLGWSRRALARDMLAGAAAFVLLAPLVYALQLLLTQWIPDYHPVLEALEQTPTVSLFLVSALAAVGVAPFFEEMLVRVLFQGWLERIAVTGLDFRGILLGGRGKTGDDRGHQRPVETSAASVTASDAGEEPPPLAAPQTAPSGDAGAVPRWPLLVSAGLFAALHWSHGPAAIPLFVLAIGLGYLYYKTHRVWPCIVMHALFNAFSLTLFWLGELIKARSPL